MASRLQPQPARVTTRCRAPRSLRSSRRAISSRAAIPTAKRAGWRGSNSAGWTRSRKRAATRAARGGSTKRRRTCATACAASARIRDSPSSRRHARDRRRRQPGDLQRLRRAVAAAAAGAARVGAHHDDALDGRQLRRAFLISAGSAAVRSNRLVYRRCAASGATRCMSVPQMRSSPLVPRG